MDLVVRNVRLRGMDEPCDIGIVGEVIRRIEPRLAGACEREIDGDGGLAIPSFVDSHSHLDKSMMIYQSPPAVSGTITESLARSYVAKRSSSVADVVARGRQALEWAVANGTGAIRVHSDVDFGWGTTGVEGLLELKRMFAGLVDLQVLVLPAANPLNDELRALVRRGMDLGADAIGGSPHLEHSPAGVARYVDFVFAIAKEYDVDVDLHIDQNTEAASDTRGAEVVLAKTLTEGYEGRVTLNHWGALSAYPEDEAARVIELAKEARINFCACPKEELIISGMGPSRIKQLVAAGVNCAYAHNNNADMFSPYGRMDMLEAGLFTLHAGEFNTMTDAETVMDMGTVNPARIMGLGRYGIAEGATANLNVLSAPSAYEAFRQNADRRYVIRRGRLVAETTTRTKLHFDVAGA
ncbi:MAG: amidohydrolase family protein [Acidimicrobiia bacterium]|nr:amidohydrolase family protein [Acidimicrobiia bacterium]